MQRVIFFVFLTFIVTGCSIFKRGTDGGNLEYMGPIYGVDLLNENISNIDFDIQKIAIEVTTSGETRSFLANLKYRAEGNYLVSIRTKIGMEIARVNIKSDSIFIYDRLNKQLYEENKSYFLEKYGFDISLLPLIFGDVLGGNEVKNQQGNCSDGVMTINNSIDNIFVKYDIDCDLRKPDEILISDSYSALSKITFADYFLVSGYNFPTNIYINASYFDYTVKLDFDNIVINPETDINFNIPDDVSRSVLY